MSASRCPWRPSVNRRAGSGDPRTASNSLVGAYPYLLKSGALDYSLGGVKDVSDKSFTENHDAFQSNHSHQVRL